MTPEQLAPQAAMNADTSRGLDPTINALGQKNRQQLALHQLQAKIESQAKEIERLKAELNYAKEELHGMICDIPDPGIPHRMAELRDRIAKVLD